MRTAQLVECDTMARLSRDQKKGNELLTMDALSNSVA
jgi:hypothetical protein